MSQYKDLEEQADAFLADHDPYYRDRRRNKSRRIEFSYLTKSQMERVKSIEIPISALSQGELEECLKKNLESNFRDVKEGK